MPPYWHLIRCTDVGFRDAGGNPRRSPASPAPTGVFLWRDIPGWDPSSYTLGMLNIGAGELVVILLVALLVLGPDKLPSTARTIGKTLTQLRRLSSGFENEVRSAMQLDEFTGSAPNRQPSSRASATPTAASRQRNGLHPGLGAGPKLSAAEVNLGSTGPSQSTADDASQQTVKGAFTNGDAASGPTESFS